MIKRTILTTTVIFFLAAFPSLASELPGTISTGIVMIAPTASPVPGTYISTQSVSLSAVGSRSIRYTTNGVTPTCSLGNVYTSAIAVNSTTTIKAVSCYPGNGASSVATFVYTINLTITPAQLPSLLSNGTFLLPPEATHTSTPSISVTQQVTITVTNGGTSTVVLPPNSTITRIDGSNFDATALTAATVSPDSLFGLGTGVVVDGALQWGLQNLGLNFSPPINVSIFVGTSFNGQTLAVQRSTTGNSGWTSDGIVLPATCVVANGLCSFTATKASYYAVTSGGSTPPAPPVPSGGGGGGGGGGSSGGGGGTSPSPAPSPTPTPSQTSNPGQVLGTIATNAHPNGTLILEGQTIFIVKDGKRYGFRNPEEYFSHGYAFSQAVPANDSDRALPEAAPMKALEGTLVLDATDGRTVYMIGLNGMRRGFTSAEVFGKLGYSFKGLLKTNLSDYTAGPVINLTSEAHPEGALVLDQGTVWWVRNGNRMGFESEAVFKTYGFTFGRVVAANAADMALPAGPLVKFRDGTLVNDQGTIYIISDGKKIGFRSMNALNTRGYAIRNAIQAKTDAYEAGVALD